MCQWLVCQPNRSISLEKSHCLPACALCCIGHGDKDRQQLLVFKEVVDEVSAEADDESSEQEDEISSKHGACVVHSGTSCMHRVVGKADLMALWLMALWPQKFLPLGCMQADTMRQVFYERSLFWNYIVTSTS